MTGIHLPELIPKTILRHWIENDDYLHAYSLLENWTPFEAACLINNYEPGAISGGIVRIGQEPDPANGEDYNQEPQEQSDQEYLITLTKIILRNNNNQA